MRITVRRAALGAQCHACSQDGPGSSQRHLGEGLAYTAMGTKQRGLSRTRRTPAPESLYGTRAVAADISWRKEHWRRL